MSLSSEFGALPAFQVLHALHRSIAHSAFVQSAVKSVGICTFSPSGQRRYPFTPGITSASVRSSAVPTMVKFTSCFRKNGESQIRDPAGRWPARSAYWHLRSCPLNRLIDTNPAAIHDRSLSPNPAKADRRSSAEGYPSTPNTNTTKHETRRRRRQGESSRRAILTAKGSYAGIGRTRSALLKCNSLPISIKNASQFTQFCFS